MRTAIAALLLLSLASAISGQELEPGVTSSTSLRSYPEFSPEKIQSEFHLGHWILKKSEFRKHGTDVVCQTQVFEHSKKREPMHDPAFCKEAAELYQTIPELDITWITVILQDIKLREKVQKTSEDKFIKAPTENLFVIGYREGPRVEPNRWTSDEQVNAVISALYSLDLANITYLFGHRVSR